MMQSIMAPRRSLSITFTPEQLAAGYESWVVITTPSIITEPTIVTARIRLLLYRNGLLIHEHIHLFSLTLKLFTTVADLLTSMKPLISYRFPRGTGTSLNSKLDAAARMTEAGNYTVAINQVAAAINQLEALTGKTIALKPVTESDAALVGYLLDWVSKYLQQQPPKECVCVWDYRIRTVYYEPEVNAFDGAKALIRMHTSGTYASIVGGLAVAGTEYSLLSESLGYTATIIEVELKEKCKDCEPKIDLSGGLSAHLMASFWNDLGNLGVGESICHLEGEAKEDLTYEAGGAARAGNRVTGWARTWAGEGPVESVLVAGTATLDLRTSNTSIRTNFAEVRITNDGHGRLSGTANLGTVGLKIKGEIDHTLIIYAKCEPHDKECKCEGRSLVIGLHNAWAGVYQDGAFTELSVLPQPVELEKGPERNKWQ